VADAAAGLLAEILSNSNAPTLKAWRGWRRRARTAKRGTNDPAALNALWSIEAFAQAMALYVDAFRKMKSGEHYEAWRALEQVEITLASGARNLFMPELQPLIAERAATTALWQSLFPYRFFFSPGMIKQDWACSICGKKSTPIDPCGHITGRVYAGEFCSRLVKKVELLEISIVTEPVQKYSVLFPKGKTYNYDLVDVVLGQLKAPFDRWGGEWGYKRHDHSLFPDVDLDARCPCGSDLRYSECCRPNSGVRLKHFTLFGDDPRVAPNDRVVGTYRTSGVARASPAPRIGS
jgi:hypothetical protein